MLIQPLGVALAVSNTRRPNVAVLVNAEQVGGIIDVEITAGSHLAAGRFRFRAALDTSGAAIWSASDLEVTVRLGMDGAWVTMMVGEADRVEIDPIRGEVSVDGRDLAARLQAARTQETFENQTASEIATALALRHGLIPVVTDTIGRVGRDFQNSYARTTLDQYSRATTEWDLLTRLAETEGCDVWVSGRSLYFTPLASAAATLVLTPADCITMRLERTVGLDGPLEVLVKSWDCRGQTAVSQRAATSAEGDNTASYVLVRPNLVADAAQSLADRVLGQITQHARTIAFDMPGELTMMPRMGITLSQSGTDFDGYYTIVSLERRLSFKHGFTQSVQARRPSWIASSIL